MPSSLKVQKILVVCNQSFLYTRKSNRKSQEAKAEFFCSVKDLHNSNQVPNFWPLALPLFIWQKLHIFILTEVIQIKLYQALLFISIEKVVNYKDKILPGVFFFNVFQKFQVFFSVILCLLQKMKSGRFHLLRTFMRRSVVNVEAVFKSLSFASSQLAHLGQLQKSGNCII